MAQIMTMKSTKALLLPVAAICVLMLAGCGGKSPKSATENYLDNLKLYNYPAC
jgi:uncharacterized lipoprotein YehR (DUF1307 family)